MLPVELRIIKEQQLDLYVASIFSRGRTRAVMLENHDEALNVRENIKIRKIIMHTIPNQVDIVPLVAYSQKCAGHAVVLLRDLAENITRLLLVLSGVDARWRSASRHNKQYTDETGKTTSDRTRREPFCVTNYTLCRKENYLG